MTGKELKRYRKARGRTQVETAEALGVSQTYLSLLEAGKRPVTLDLQEKLAVFLEVPPTELPTHLVTGELPHVSDAELAADLADLGYLGFSHLKRKRPHRKNPADVLLTALNAPQREARAVEALPWLLFRYADMNWDQVVRVAKMHDLQNRLGFLVSVARRAGEDRRLDGRTLAKLKACESNLEHSKLVRQDTLCNDTMTNAEREWLETQRPAEARNWHLLTGLVPKHLSFFYEGN